MPKPDFAFPQTVEAESRLELEKALKDGRPVDALRAFINQTIASTSISRENAPALISELDSITLSLPAPYSAVGQLLEAKIYTAIYGADRYLYNQRTAEPGMEDKNPQFWDRDIFASKIDSLLNLALSEKKEALETPIESIAPLIYFDSPMKGFTVYDFIVYMALELNGSVTPNDVIPFFIIRENAIDPVKLVDGLLAVHTAPSQARLTAILTKVQLLQEGAADFLWKEINACRDTDYIVPLLINYYPLISNQDSPGPREFSGEEREPADLTEYYNFVKALKKKLPQGEARKKLSEILDLIESQSVELDFYTHASTSQPTEVIIKAKNINDLYVILLRKKTASKQSCPISSMARYYEKIGAKRIRLEGEVPFTDTSSVSFDIKEPGVYTFVASRTPEPAGIIRRGDEDFHPTLFTVSDIDLFCFGSSSGRETDTKGETGCFIVRTSDGQPVEGAEVTFYDETYERYKKEKNKETAKTDRDGFAPTNFKWVTAHASFKGSEAEGGIRQYGRHYSPNPKIRMFADRAVYRPGDTVRFFGIVYNAGENEASLLPAREISLQLKNANWEVVDSLTLTTDLSGRFFGEFTLPQDGLLGSWHIQNENNGNLYFEVAEYKTPSLFVTLEKIASSADSVGFKGVVSTYSGMPLQNVKVDFTVSYSAWRFFFGNNKEYSPYSSSVQTDDKGEFRISLPLGNLDPKDFRGIFRIKASATDNAGETADSPFVAFWLSSAYSIIPSLPSLVEVTGDTVKESVKVTDMADLPAVKEVEYKIENARGELVDEGCFESPLFQFSAGTLPSGKYKITFNLKDGDALPTVSDVVLYRPSDTVPPVETPLWVPEKNIIAENGRSKVSIKYGSSYPGQNILCIVSDSQGGYSRRWIVSEGENATVEIEVPNDTVRKFVRFVACREHDYYQETVTVIPAAQQKRLEIETSTFRTSIDPGAQEEWSFSLRYGGDPIEGYAYALLYDKAMDAIAPLRWNSSLFSPVYPDPVITNFRGNYHACFYFRGKTGYLPSYYLKQPGFETYGFSLYGHPFYRAIRKNMSSSKSLVFNECSGDFMMEDADYAAMPEIAEVTAMKTATFGGDANDYMVSASGVVVEEEADDQEDSGEGHEDVEFREVEMPVAFFMPDLVSDPEGNVEIKFTVPNFNTTWNFLMGAYTPSLANASTRLETVASKKVMVKMLAPRFIRTGDKAVITATLYNNSDAELPIRGEFEIFDPASGAILVREVCGAERVRPSGNSVVSVSFDCPDIINAVGLRVFAKAEGVSDGEQTVIPVLPSSQPVVESIPFYLAPGQKTFSMELPKSKGEGETVTFQYSDNPTWEVVTALCPIVIPDSESLTAQFSAFYSNCVGAGIMKNNESIRNGLSLVIEGEAGDSLLTSNLEKNPELKLVTLNNTLWVNDARSETLRLSRLGSLLDERKADEAILTAWKKIMALRNPDGGWSWCPGMQSSSWMTQAFIINVGLVKGAGYLPELPDLNESVKGAVSYVDSSIIEAYAKTTGSKEWIYNSMTFYLYARSFFPEIAGSSAFSKIRKEALDYMESHWEKMDIFTKATAAVVLWRNNRKMTAREILESLRQFTSESPEKGAWFDNLDSDWRGAGKLLVTARVLTAFHEIVPSDALIDRMRQWMLLQRQAQDWQEGLWSIDAIDALLTTGTSWTGSYAPPVISICGETVGSSEMEKLTGHISVTLDSKSLKRKDRKIEIVRNAPSPAWGGVISQRIAPMESVKAVDIPDLSIEKAYWRLEEGPEGTKAVATDMLRVGDKVRVTMVIDCGRDMDFVALTDERAACLEPADQLSGYTVIDGLWCYLETRNSATNLFFNFLPRGRHIVSYECRVMEEGEFASGIATLQCLYSPVLTAHSAGRTIVCGK